MREHGIAFSEPAKRGRKVRGVSTRQYQPRPERGGGQVLFVEAHGRAWRSGSVSSLRFFAPWVRVGACCHRRVNPMVLSFLSCVAKVALKAGVNVLTLGVG